MEFSSTLLKGGLSLAISLGESNDGVTPLLVSVYDVKEGDRSLGSEVKTVDIAKLMIAIEEFYVSC